MVSAEGLLKAVVDSIVRIEQSRYPWIEGRIASQSAISEAELAAEAAKNPVAYQLPPRYRISHIFLAAHPETPVEIASNVVRSAGVAELAVILESYTAECTERPGHG